MTTSTALAKADAAAVEKQSEVINAEVVEDNGLETVNLGEWRKLRDKDAEELAARTVRLIRLWWHNQLGTQAELSKEMGVTPRTVWRKVQELRAKGVIPQLPVTDGRKDAQKDRKKNTKAPSAVLDDYQNVKRGAELVFSKVPANRISKRVQAEILLAIAGEFMEHADQKDDAEAREVIEQETATWQETIRQATATKPKQLPGKKPGTQMTIDMGTEPTPKPTPEPEWGDEAPEAQEPTPEPTPAPESKGTADQKPAEESDTATESDEAPKGPEPGEGLNPTFEQVAAEANCK